MKDDKNKPTPLQERLHGEELSEENKEKASDTDEVVKGGQAGSPFYKNMNNEDKKDSKDSK